MRDGVRLLADHYVPTGGPARGTILVRSPYGRAGAFAMVYARPYAERGYHVVVQSCRGTYGSGGAVNAFAGEVEDGADTVAWLRTEPWFTGTFATLGVSYLGFNQWALLVEPPPELAAAVIVSGPHDASRLLYGAGALALLSVVGWSHLMLHQEDHGPVTGLLVSAVLQDRQMAPVLNGLPLGQAANEVFKGHAPWHDRWLAHPDITHPFWQDTQLGDALQRADVPVLLYSGWQDMILEQTLEQYDALSSRGVDVSLTVGPWNHAELLTRASGITARDTLAWLSEHLVGDGKRLATGPVRVCVTGSNEWRDLAAWPPPARDETLHLQPGGALGQQVPDADAEPTSFTYDPTDPTPMVGGLTNARTAGSRDNAEREARSDVLTFTGPVLQQDLEVIGIPVVELAHTSDNPHADVFVRLCEVDAKGRSWNLSERYLRLDPARSAGVLRLELNAIAHLFRAGTRLRLQISGGSHPQHDRNLGTGEPPVTGTTTRPSRQTIAHGRGGLSRIVLPVGETAPEGRDVTPS
jgi:putative CocE/NonD family hydrolase